MMFAISRLYGPRRCSTIGRSQDFLISWAGTLEGILHASGRDTTELQHCMEIARHENPLYLNSGESLQAKMHRLAGHQLVPLGEMDSRLQRMMDYDAIGAAFSGRDAYVGAPEPSQPLIRSTRGLKGEVAFQEEDLSDGMFCLYRWEDPQLPVRLGKVLRCCHESKSAPFAVIQSWWPLLKPSKFGSKLNAFGTWCAGTAPIAIGSSIARKQRKTQVQSSPLSKDNAIFVNMEDILLWPVDFEIGALDDGQDDNSGLPDSSGSPEGRRIPFNCFVALWRRYGINFADNSLAFSSRGKGFQKFVSRPSPSSSSSSSSSDS